MAYGNRLSPALIPAVPAVLSYAMGNSSGKPERNDQESRLHAVVLEPSDAEYAPSSNHSVADYVGYGDDAPDGGYESDGLSSASMSAESSVRNYRYENGRRYHSFREGSYNFPNDNDEQEREDMVHTMLKLPCNQKLYFAPIISNPQEVLDIRTGTGIWAIESRRAFIEMHSESDELTNYSGGPVSQCSNSWC